MQFGACSLELGILNPQRGADRKCTRRLSGSRSNICTITTRPLGSWNRLLYNTSSYTEVFIAERRRCLPEVILVTTRVQLRSLLVVHAIVGEPLGYLDGSVGEACFENPRGLDPWTRVNGCPGRSCQRGNERWTH